jgi:hypothetical protein
MRAIRAIYMADLARLEHARMHERPCVIKAFFA